MCVCSVAVSLTGSQATEQSLLLTRLSELAWGCWLCNKAFNGHTASPCLPGANTKFLFTVACPDVTELSISHHPRGYCIHLPTEIHIKIVLSLTCFFNYTIWGASCITNAVAPVLLKYATMELYVSLPLNLEKLCNFRNIFSMFLKRITLMPILCTILPKVFTYKSK